MSYWSTVCEAHLRSFGSVELYLQGCVMFYLVMFYEVSILYLFWGALLWNSPNLVVYFEYLLAVGTHHLGSLQQEGVQPCVMRKLTSSMLAV